MQCFFPALTICPLYGSMLLPLPKGLLLLLLLLQKELLLLQLGLARLDFLCNLRLGVLINATSLHVWGRLSIICICMCAWVCVHGSAGDPLCRYRFIFINIFNFVQLGSFKVVNSPRNACVAMLALPERERDREGEKELHTSQLVNRAHTVNRCLVCCYFQNFWRTRECVCVHNLAQGCV